VLGHVGGHRRVLGPRLYRNGAKVDGAGVLEIVDDFERRSYRAVYTVKLGDAVYVLHAFQKKCTRGIATRKEDIELIEQRLKQARAHHEQEYGQWGNDTSKWKRAR
jgi:phage-related protein